jgi:beta-lactamase regulating signal transducer with metallopeptidase domain
MKKSVLVFSMTLLLIIGGINVTVAQDQPSPKKDTINMDTNAKPTFYNAVEDEKKGKSPVLTIVLITGVVVVIGAAAYFLLKKKK